MTFRLSKAFLYTMVATLLVVTMVSCSDSDEPVSGVKPQWTVVQEVGANPELPDYNLTVPSGSDPFPDWQQPDNSLYSTSMHAVMRMPENILPFASPDDVLAAFIGDECRGISTVDNIGSELFYFIGIKGDDGESRPVELRYYCARLSRLFTAAELLDFVADGRYGSPSSPYVPAFNFMTIVEAYVKIESSLIPYVTSRDILAVFVGDECRGMGERVNNGVYRVSMMVASGEKYNFRYYNYRLDYLFESSYDIMEWTEVIGSLDNPYNLYMGLNDCRPLVVDMFVALPVEIQQNVGPDDMLGVFVGDECRGLSSLDSPPSALGYGLALRAKLADEDCHILYYNAATQTIYRSPVMPLDKNGMGTSAKPLTVSFTKQ